MLVGVSFLTLKNLAYMCENKLEAKILSSEGKNGVNGLINLSYAPCAENGIDEPEDDVFCDEPHELVGKTINFRLEIENASGLPMELCKNSYVTYGYKYEPDTLYSTEKCDGLNQTPNWKYSKVHTIDCVSDYIVDYFQSSNIPFHIWAEPMLEGKGGKKINRQAVTSTKKVVTPRSDKVKPAPAKPTPAPEQKKTESTKTVVTET